MKKIIILLSIAVIVCIIAYVTLFGESSNRELTSDEKALVPSDQVVNTETQTEQLAGTDSLIDLKNIGRDLECKIVYLDEGTSSSIEGTYFVSDGMVRGDFLTDAPDLSGQVLSSIIIVDDQLYSWTELDGQSYGVKLLLNSLTEDNTTPNRPQPVPVPTEAPLDYECKNWPNVDGTVFVPPSDVLFRDYSDLLQTGMEEGLLYESEVELE